MLKEILSREAEKVGIFVSDRQLELFEKYYVLLIEWNEKINLTSITDPGEVAIKHFLDSLLITKDIDLASIESMIDVGTGAGFPGIPLKIINPHLKLTLLDSLQKRCKFLEEVTVNLNLTDVNILHDRAENAASKNEHREKYDISTARAVAKLRVIAEYCIPFVKLGGYFISPKGKDGLMEAEDAKNAIRVLGAELVAINKYNLPDNVGERNNVIIKKTRQSPSQYPRKAGTPEKKPL